MRVAGVALICVALGLSACGKPQGTAEPQQTVSTPTAALAPPSGSAAPSATASEQQAVGLAPAPPGKVRHQNEDGSETVEDTAGDSGSHNALLAAVASTMAAATPTAAAATTTGPTLWQEGSNYTRLVPAQPTNVPAGQVEVLEFFWYGCPHCYALDPLIESWKKTKPAYVSFARVPVMWSEGHRSTARLFYTLESMGKLDQLHGEIFKEIHVNNDPLIAADPNDSAGAERVQTAFVAKLGVPADAFTKAYHSFAVETSLQRADQLGQRYRIEGVPTFVINGKFVADVALRRWSGQTDRAGRRSCGSRTQALTGQAVPPVDSAAGRMVKHAGGCHCGRVRFEVLASAVLDVSECNCSICGKFGYLHLIVPAERFSLLCGGQDITTYTFNTGIAQHHFCSHCGVKSFYIPRSHPDCVSVNVRCLDEGTVERLTVTPFDGRHWEDARHTLA